MSGSSLSPWALVKEPSIYAKQVAQSVNCSFQLPHQILLKCLRDRPLESLVNVSVQVSEFNTAFGPNIDGVIIDIVLSDKMKIAPSGTRNITIKLRLPLQFLELKTSKSTNFLAPTT